VAGDCRHFAAALLLGRKGRESGKVPLAKSWEGLIVDNSCLEGIAEDLKRNGSQQGCSREVRKCLSQCC